MSKRKPRRSREFKKNNQVIDIEEARRERREKREKAAKKAAALAELWQKEQAKAKPFYEKMQKALGEDNI